MGRPVLFVLAGVNGAGKSSLGGRAFVRDRRSWFNPDTYARELVDAEGCDRLTADRRAGEESIRLFRTAVADRHDYAFETTLGGRTMVRKLIAAATSHDVIVWFCGLASADLHVERVRARVAQGGHNIAEAQIRERYVTAPRNLIALLPHLTHLQVYDNSTTVPIGTAVPDPQLVLDMTARAVRYPRVDDADQLQSTPHWAIPIVEKALQRFDGWAPSALHASCDRTQHVNAKKLRPCKSQTRLK